jgi:hypothetical protein
MKIGDLVWEYVGGPIMRIVGFLDLCRVAVCRCLRSGFVKRVAVQSLIAVGLAVESAHGYGPEEPPSRPVVEREIQVTAITSSGMTTPTTPAPPRPIIARAPDDSMQYPGTSGSVWLCGPVGWRMSS